MQPHELFDFLAKNRKFVAAWFVLAIVLIVAHRYGFAFGQDSTVQFLWAFVMIGGAGCGCLLAMDLIWWLKGETQARRARLAETKQADAIAWSNLQACTARSALSLMYIVRQVKRQRFIGPAHNEHLNTLVGLKLLHDGPLLSDGSAMYRVRDSIWTKLADGPPPPWDDLRVPQQPPWIDQRRI